MRDDRADELRALRRVLEVCRAQAVDLDMPALTHILSRAEASLSSYQADPPQVPPARALSVPRQRAVRHWRH